MDAVVAIDGVCEGGNHLLITATVGEETVALSLDKKDIAAPRDGSDLSAIIARGLRLHCRRNNITTVSALRAASPVTLDL